MIEKTKWISGYIRSRIIINILIKYINITIYNSESNIRFLNLCSNYFTGTTGNENTIQDRQYFKIKWL